MMEFLRVAAMILWFNSFLLFVFIGLLVVYILEKVGIIKYEEE